MREDEEAVFFFYNLQPVHNPCPGDFYGRNVCGDYYPCNATGRGAAHCGNVCTNCTWCDDGMAATAEFPVEDMLYVTTLLATPWARVVQSSDKAVNNCDQVKVVLPSATSSDIKEDKDKEILEDGKGDVKGEIEEEVQVQSDDLTLQGEVEVEEREVMEEERLFLDKN